MNINTVRDKRYYKAPWKDYENYDYRIDWNGRDYEHEVECIALRKLLPKDKESIIDLGANYGRYIHEFDHLTQIVLVDGAFSAGVQALSINKGHKFSYVVCDIRQISLKREAFDVAICIRVLHHNNEDIERIFSEVRDILKPGGLFIFSFANKRNARQRLLSLIGRSNNRITDQDPVATGENIWNFHPEHVYRLLVEAGFKKEQQLGVALFRDEWLFKNLSANIMRFLVKIDNILQPVSGNLQLTGNIMIQARKT